MAVSPPRRCAAGAVHPERRRRRRRRAVARRRAPATSRRLCGQPARPAHHSLPVPFSGRSWPLPPVSPDPNSPAMPEDLPPPIPAATLILMRPRGSRPPEILMMERAQNMAFAAGALVFPGGRIDADDHASAAALAPHLSDAPARIAAIRETIEETGIA